MPDPATPAPRRRILGVDPGLASTGVGVIEETADGRWRCLECGDVRSSPSMALADRLKRIHDLVRGMIDRHHPEAMAVESLFFARNVRSAVLMAHGRGAAILAASQAGIALHEYSPAEIKQSVAGGGRAQKDQIGRMVTTLLGMAAPPSSDHQADALACALTHAFRSRLGEAVKRSETKSVGDRNATEKETSAKTLLAQAFASRKKRRPGR